MEACRDLEARWAKIKTTLGAIKGNIVATMGLTIIVNMIEFAGKAFDKPGASDHFALAAMNDEEILDTWAEIELELMENSQLAMQMKPKLRFCLRLFMCYQKNLGKNLNLGGKSASENLMGREWFINISVHDIYQRNFKFDYSITFVIFCNFTG